MKNKILGFAGLGLVVSPMFAFAQTTNCNAVALGQLGTLDALLCKIGSLLNSIVPVLIALGVVYFIWGVVSYVISDDEEAKKAGKDRMIYGIIGLAVIVSVWGLVSILKNTFGLGGSNTNTVQVPCIPLPGNTSC
ncbi:pilin [Candidatus Nomurabacteria bacterium]|nr:pilin [Candidatus Nomurabacteria bacterium]